MDKITRHVAGRFRASERCIVNFIAKSSRHAAARLLLREDVAPPSRICSPLIFPGSFSFLFIRDFTQYSMPFTSFSLSRHGSGVTRAMSPAISSSDASRRLIYQVRKFFTAKRRRQARRIFPPRLAHGPVAQWHAALYIPAYHQCLLDVSGLSESL